jgi:hypothetical protein
MHHLFLPLATFMNRVPFLLVRQVHGQTLIACYSGPGRNLNRYALSKLTHIKAFPLRSDHLYRSLHPNPAYAK